jgi:hypothetical protein
MPILNSCLTNRTYSFVKKTTTDTIKNVPMPVSDDRSAVPESKLDKRVQNLIELVCNVKAMEAALLEMKYDARKSPLGRD